jgi:hypothetical protein
MLRIHSGGRFHARPSQPVFTEPTEPTEAPALQPTAEIPRMPLAPVEQQSVRRGPSAVPTVTTEQAYTLFRRGETPNALIVNGPLNLRGSAWLHTLPTWLRCTSLVVDDCVNLSVLPSDLHAERLSARRTPSLKEVDGRLSVRDTINLRGSGVQTIRADLHATRLNLAHCTSLRQLEGRVSVVHLDVRGCTSLQKLDDGVHVTQTLELAESGLTAVPSTLRAGLRWNDVPVDAKVAFTPELLSGRDIMNTSNVQRRRMLLERIGVQRFLADVGGLIIDRDHDTGGERQLVRVPFDDDEPLVAVLVRCPSTRGQYALRVPPHIRTCREAVAWIADLDPDSYQPIQET